MARGSRYKRGSGEWKGGLDTLGTFQKHKKTWAWLAAGLLLFMGFGYFVSTDQPDDYPSYLSESPAPTGTKAIYTYLENNHDQVKRWKNQPQLLTGRDEDQLLLMIQPFLMLDDLQVDEYVAYMEAGNTIMLLSDNPKEWFDVSVKTATSDTEEISKVWDMDNKEWEALIDSQVRLAKETRDEVMLEDEQGIIAMKRSVGDGELIVVNSPDWLTNESIIQNNHLELYLSLFETDHTYSTILFDEYIHGLDKGSSPATLFPKWLVVFTLQLALLTLLWLWYRGKRFGPVRVPREETVRLGHEKTSALAAWYLRGKRYQDSLAIRADDLKIRLQEKWAIPYRKNWKESGELILQKDNRYSEKGIRSFVEGLTYVLNKESVNKQEYLAWSKKVDKLKREVDKE